MRFEDKLPYWKEQFRWGSQAPISWLISSRQLKRVSDLAFSTAEQGNRRKWESIRSDEFFEEGEREMSEEEVENWLDAGLTSVGWMLLGFALENLAKGVLVQRDPELSEGGIRASSKLCL